MAIHSDKKVHKIKFNIFQNSETRLDANIFDTSHIHNICYFADGDNETIPAFSNLCIHVAPTAEAWIRSP